MIKIEKIDVYGFRAAIRGMRNPMNSWGKSDSCYDENDDFVVGMNDLNLMHKLYISGTEHRKYLRMIHVSMDVTAPLYWWKEFDTYKIGTVSNSCSTMHKITERDLTLDDFSHEHLVKANLEALQDVIDGINEARHWFLRYDDMLDKDKVNFDPSIESSKDLWWQMIQMLPTSFNQKRTIDLNYENVLTIIKQREGHKLDEWNMFVLYLKNYLPYVNFIMNGGFPKDADDDNK